jgi:hypothetical protein
MMTTLPKHFEACQIEVQVGSIGPIGIVVGILYHYPHWTGILEPAPTLDDWRDELLNTFEQDSLDAHFEDLVSKETWVGTVCDLTMPEPDYPWYELYWRDDRRLAKGQPSSLLGKLDQKLGDILWKLLTRRHD